MAAPNCEPDVVDIEEKLAAADLLNQTNLQKIIEFSTSAETSSSQIYHLLMKIVQKISEQFVVNALAEETQHELDQAYRLAIKLRKNAQANNAVRYYYYGVYNEKLTRLRTDMIKQRSVSIQQEAASRKNFKAIMCHVYYGGLVRQSDLARHLNMERGNLSREMEHLVTAGFIEQRKAGKYRLYNLSAMGESYWNRYLNIRNQFDPSLKDYDINDVIISYDINYSDALEDEKLPYAYIRPVAVRSAYLKPLIGEIKDVVDSDSLDEEEFLYE